MIARHPTFEWTERPGIVRIMAALNAAGPDTARFVGGCVRDSLLGLVPKDIDAATRLRPDDTIAALCAAGLRFAPTGLDHGTVTAIADDVTVEVTTLRADISTDGRRAIVSYTEDWAMDARRRDFTINALYRLQDGAIFDPTGGLADLKAGRVKFIGDPSARIQEDYLRILRFFRFSGRFTIGALDSAGLAACKSHVDGIKRLSAERIGAELMAIFALERPADIVGQMAEIGALAAIWPAEPKIDVLRRLKATIPDAVPVLCLAALWPETDDSDGLGSALRLSNVDSRRRVSASRHAGRIPHLNGRAEVRRAVYEFGADGFRDAVALAIAREAISVSAGREISEISEKDVPGPFPISGKDVLALGVKGGPDIGAILSAVEKLWIESDFPEEARVREILAELISTRR